MRRNCLARRYWSHVSLSLAVACWAGLPAQAAAPARSDRSAPPVRIVYFATSDRQPLAGYRERLDRVMTEVQRFYRAGMQAAGYGPKTFRLERDEQGRLLMDVVNGKYPMRSYGRNDSQKVRDEVKAALAARGVEIGRRTIVIFQTLLEWENGRANASCKSEASSSNRACTPMLRQNMNSTWIEVGSDFERPAACRMGTMVPSFSSSKATAANCSARR